MSDEYRFEDLAADEIAELLAEQGSDLTESQALALKQLLDQLGVDNALAAVEMLGEMGKAA